MNPLTKKVLKACFIVLFFLILLCIGLYYSNNFLWVYPVPFAIWFLTKSINANHKDDKDYSLDDNDAVFIFIILFLSIFATCILYFPSNIYIKPDVQKIVRDLKEIKKRDVFLYNALITNVNKEEK